VGYGAYSHEAHEALTATRTAAPVQTMFAQRACHPLMNPRGIRARESRDSVDHPASLAIAFALDVTSSMGEIPEALARRELPNLMKLLGSYGVRDPQILFMAVGDAVGDRAPLQVGQFESTAELMDQWLTWTWLEGGGGAAECESYELALYFAAQHIEMDCHRKRKKRGYLFMTGDDRPYPLLSRHIVDEVFGDKLENDVPLPQLVATLAESFEPFFLIPDLERRARAERPWRDLIGDRVVCLEHPDDVCVVAASLVALNEGLVTLPELGARFARDDKSRVGRLVRAMTPFASSIGRDGAPEPSLESFTRPEAESTSGLIRP
jgi:hypothetical protein